MTTSRVEVLEGLPGIRTVFDDIVSTGKELVGWGATDRARQLLPEFTGEYIRRREEQNIRARQLAVEGRSVLETPYSRFKYIPAEYSSPATTLIYGDTVAIMMWFSEPILSIRIASPEISAAYRNHFEFLWGTRLFSAEEILASTLVREEIHNAFGNEPYEVIERLGARVIRLNDERPDRVTRLILLPPEGRTAGDYSKILEEHDRFSPHPEALRAKITIRGGVAPGRLGYRKIDRGIRFSYFPTRDADVAKEQCIQEYKSSHQPAFAVVKPNGYGFWHNLENTSNEWALLVLEKELLPPHPLRWQRTLRGLSAREKTRIHVLADAIANSGDHVFQGSADPLKGLAGIKPADLARILVAFLNFPDRGNHEPCTATALLLKLAKRDRNAVVRACEKAVRQRSAPPFYLREILRKLMKPLSHESGRVLV